MSDYKFINTPDFRNVDLKLYYCGTERCMPSHSWGPAVKDHFKIHYIHGGKGVFQTGGHTYSLQKGQLFLIYPNTISYYAADSEDPWSYSWVAFNGVSAESYLTRGGLCAEHPILQCTHEDLIGECFNNMFEASKASKSSDLKLLSSLYSFFALIIDSASNTSSYDEGRQSENKTLYIKKSIEFMETNYSRKITIEDVASHVNLSRKYLSKIFSHALEMSPQYYLINLRIEKACALMRNSPLSITEVSNSVGYSDPLLFSKIFKRYRGISPKEYRKFY